MVAVKYVSKYVKIRKKYAHILLKNNDEFCNAYIEKGKRDRAYCDHTFWRSWSKLMLEMVLKMWDRLIWRHDDVIKSVGKMRFFFKNVTFSSPNYTTKEWSRAKMNATFEKEPGLRFPKITQNLVLAHLVMEKSRDQVWAFFGFYDFKNWILQLLTWSPLATIGVIELEISTL